MKLFVTIFAAILSAAAVIGGFSYYQQKQAERRAHERLAAEIKVTEARIELSKLDVLAVQITPQEATKPQVEKFRDEVKRIRATLNSPAFPNKTEAAAIGRELDILVSRVQSALGVYAPTLVLKDLLDGL